MLIMFRTLNCMIGQMKHILTTEQKKTDFRPEDENNAMTALQYTTVSNSKFCILLVYCKCLLGLICMFGCH